MALINRKTISRTNCCVFGCSTRADRDTDITFHIIPKEGARNVKVVNKLGIEEIIDIRKAWDMAIKSGKSLTSSMKVCSRHFLKEDYILPDIPCKKKSLKKMAVPSQHLPLQSSVGLSAQRRIHRQEQRNLTLQQANSSGGSDLFCQGNNENEPLGCFNDTENRLELDNVLDNLSTPKEHISECQCNNKVDIGVQVKSGDLILPFIDILNSNCKLNTATGIPSIQLLETIVSLIDSHNVTKRPRKLNTKERVILTFMKLKLDISYLVLSILFRTISSQTCKDIFHETIVNLSVVLKPAIPWPTKEECLNNMPKCFALFQNTRIVIDCTEIEVQKPKCLCCRIRTYSHYKGRHTVKFLTGVSPGGILTFISKAYGGRVSDKAIFNQSGLIEKLICGQDAIMADKGFLIENECDEHNIKLIRPPFLKKKKQFTKEEANSNVVIASARVHIERSNQRLKIFKILTNKIPWNLINIVHDILIVIASIVNLSSSILSEDKFMEV